MPRSRVFKSGNSQAVRIPADLAYADTDIDLEILDANTQKRVAYPPHEEAIVDFAPKATQPYRVRVRLFASRNHVPCVCLAIVLVK